MGFFSVFSKFGALVNKALGFAARFGLKDEIVDLALRWVRVANTKFVDNAERREWVVSVLVGKKVPESIARLAVELAYQIYRKEVSSKFED